MFRILSSRKLPNASNHETTPSPKEDVKLDEMLRRLTSEEIEVAARTSYEYFQEPDPSKTDHYAKLCALRFLRCKNGDTALALSRLQKTLAFRIEIDVDELRTAFHTTDVSKSNTTIATRLEKELRKETLFVQGYDREGHSTYIFIPRNVHGHESVDWTIRQHVYTLERAVAASQAPDGTVNAVVDFKGFSWFRNAPPRDIGAAFLTVLRSHYVGLVHKIFIVDPPRAFFFLWKLFQPFVGTKTKDKIHLVQSKTDDLADVYDPDQAASWMMSSGTKNCTFDVDEYLFQTPFHISFDEKREEQDTHQAKKNFMSNQKVDQL